MSLKKRLAVGVLSLSAAGLLSIAGYEGFSDKAYIPIEGDVPTIGFGSTQGVKMGDVITVPQALDRLRRDITVADTSLAFNIGTDAFCRSTLVVKLNGGDYAGACEEIKRWVYAGGRRVPGLVARREKEYATCVGDVR